MANAANTTPSHFICRPRSSAYMAPPCIRPSFVCTRYLTAIRLSAYLVAMPNTPVSQHHSTAPGPPRNTAVPTPTILPVPMVEASAVVSAWNWLTSPGESGSFVSDRRMPVNVLRWIKPVRTVMNRCVPSSRTIMGSPQIQLSTADTRLENFSTAVPLFLFHEATYARNRAAPQYALYYIAFFTNWQESPRSLSPVSCRATRKAVHKFCSVF